MACPGLAAVSTVPEGITPFDVKVDGSGRFYLSDPTANQVFQLDPQGTVTHKFGRLPVQKPGAYDPSTFMEPEKLCIWKDEAGNDRLIVVEQAGPNRVSEWSTDGKLLREFMSLQTYANDGYGFDPEHADHVYLPGKQGWMTRFKVDFATGEWKVDAVWPFQENDPLAGRLDRLKVIRTHGRLYIAGRRSFTIYRFDGDRLLLSAGILPVDRKSGKYALWHDSNGNGRVDEEELNRTIARRGAHLPRTELARGFVAAGPGARQPGCVAARAQRLRPAWQSHLHDLDERCSRIRSSWHAG